MFFKYCKLQYILQIFLYSHIIIKKKKIFLLRVRVFVSLLSSPGLHIFAQKYSNTVKYY